MVLSCLVYPGLCQTPFNILTPNNCKFVRCHRGATNSFFPTEVITNYLAGTSNQASPGFRILLETVIGQSYRLEVTAELTLGDKAFVYVETPDGDRLVPRTNCFLLGGGATSYVIDFVATSKLTYVGILFLCFNISYSLTTTEFLVSCIDPIDCVQVIDCLCQIDQCLDEYTYEICVDFLQVHLDLLNSPASFPVGTPLSIQGYRIDEGSVDAGATGLPQPIGIVPVTFDQVRTAFENLTWETIDLGLIGEFRATLKNQVIIISHVLIDNDLSAGMPPFSINLPTNCTQLDECATNNSDNRLLIKKPDDTLCWANICPPHIDTCLTKCGVEDHVGILPDETLSSNASLSVGPRGSGFLCAQKPLPGSIEGGDCRGMRAVDWQMLRDTPDDVAGADLSVIGGGSSNQIQDSEISLHAYGTTGAEGSVIAGGISNEINVFVYDDGDFPPLMDGLTGTDLSGAFIGGGLGNRIRVIAEDQSSFFSGQSVIVGGSNNLIQTLARPVDNIIAVSFDSQNHSGVIGGGAGNLIETDGALMRTDLSVIAGGGGTGATGFGNIIRARGIYHNYSQYAVISGGEKNRIEALNLSFNDTSHAVIGGGGRNLIQATAGGIDSVKAGNASFTVIDGGLDNRIGVDGNAGTSQFSVIGGGNSNKIVAKNAGADASNAVITGGSGNKIYAYSSVAHSTIGGGEGNLIRSYAGNDTTHGVIGGGYSNAITEGGQAGMVAGGRSNTIQVPYGSIGGGQGNQITGTSIYNSHNHIGGGHDNQIASSTHNVIGGGRNNNIDGQYSGNSTIAGGRYNQITLQYNSVIGGGDRNTISGNPFQSLNTIIGGGSNAITDSFFATIIGGSSNTITNGNFSVVGGANSTSNYNNCFVFGDTAGSTGPNQVVFNAIPQTPIPNGLNVVVKPNGILGVGSPFKIFQGGFTGIADWEIRDGSNNFGSTGTVGFEGIYTCIGFQVDVCLTIGTFIYPVGGTDYSILYDIPLINANLPPQATGANIQITPVERPEVSNVPAGVFKNVFISSTTACNLANFLRFRLNCVDLSPFLDEERVLITYIKLCYTNGDPPLNPDA